MPRKVPLPLTREERVSWFAVGSGPGLVVQKTLKSNPLALEPRS